MTKCSYCGLEDVNTVAEVAAGCKTIDAALARFSQVSAVAGQASAILNHNSLQFGSGENASLEHSLDDLQMMFARSNANNEGLTQQIIDAANDQQAEWEANVAECRRKAEEAERNKNKKK